MLTVVFSLFYSIRQGLRNRAVLQAEILALRHQLLVLQRSNGSLRPRLSFADRILWVWLSQLWAVTEYPTADSMAHQLLEAFPWDSAPHYLLRERDASYGEKCHEAASWLGIREVLTAPQSPWQ